MKYEGVLTASVDISLAILFSNCYFPDCAYLVRSWPCIDPMCQHPYENNKRGLERIHFWPLPLHTPFLPHKVDAICFQGILLLGTYKFDQLRIPQIISRPAVIMNLVRILLFNTVFGRPVYQLWNEQTLAESDMAGNGLRLFPGSDMSLRSVDTYLHGLIAAL